MTDLDSHADTHRLSFPFGPLGIAYIVVHCLTNVQKYHYRPQN